MLSQATLKVKMTMPQDKRTYRTAFENESEHALADTMFNSPKKKHPPFSTETSKVVFCFSKSESYLLNSVDSKHPIFFAYLLSDK